MLSSIPNARDMWSLLATTPSVTLNRVDVGGSTAGTQTTYFSYGYSGQNRPAHRGHQHHGRHGGRGLLPRLRLVRRSVHRRRGQLRRDAEPGRADAVCRQERRQPSVGEPLLRLRERRHPEPQPRARPVPGAGRARQRPHDPSRRQPPRQLQELQPRRRRPDRPRQDVGPLRLSEPAELGRGAAGRRDPGRDAVRHQAVQLHRQGDVSDEPDQQVHRLPAARHQAAAASHRQQQPPRRARAHHRRFDGAAGLAELGLQGRVERHDQPEHVRRVPRRAVRLQLRTRQQHRSHALRGCRSPTKSSAAAVTG